ncbi:hypothetical protein V6N13_140563 [Hibiscus sabdariffa]
MMQPWIQQAGVHASTASQLGATAPTERPSSPWSYWYIQIWVQTRNKRQLSLLIVRIQSLKSSVPNKPTASPYPKNYESEELVDIVDDDDDCNDGLRTDKQDNASEKDVGSVAEALRDQVDTEGKEQSSSSNSSSGSDSSGSGSSSSDSESKSSDGDSAISI